MINADGSVFFTSLRKVQAQMPDSALEVAIASVQYLQLLRMFGYHRFDIQPQTLLFIRFAIGPKVRIGHQNSQQLLLSLFQHEFHETSVF